MHENICSVFEIVGCEILALMFYIGWYLEKTTSSNQSWLVTYLYNFLSITFASIDLSIGNIKWKIINLYLDLTFFDTFQY